MLSIVDYLAYLPHIIAVITAFLGYIFGQKSNKTSRFHQQVENNLKELSGPLYFKGKKIVRSTDIQSKEHLLDEFFNSFSSSQIYKLGNRQLINLLINNEEAYYRFKETREIQEWDNFWKGFSSFHEYTEREYWRNFNVLYSDYRWLQQAVTSNVFIRCWHEMIHLLFQASQFGVVGSALILYFVTWDYFFIDKFPEGSMLLSLQFFITMSIISSIFIMVGSSVRELKIQRESLWFKKLREKSIPWLSNLIKNN